MQSPASVCSMIHRLEPKNNRKSKAERIKAYMLEVGQIVEGKVTGLTGFGAFVALPDGKSGMVHISEVSNVFVKDIKDHLTEGQDVKVKIIAIVTTVRSVFRSKRRLTPIVRHLLKGPGVRSAVLHRTSGRGRQRSLQRKTCLLKI